MDLLITPPCDTAPTPSDYQTVQTNFEFPPLSQPSVSSLRLLIPDNSSDALPQLTPKLSNPISVDDVDRLRQIIKNMKNKRNDGHIQTRPNCTKQLYFVCHTPNLSYKKYENDNIYKYKSFPELQTNTAHSTNSHCLYEQRWIPKPKRTETKPDMPWTYYKELTTNKLKYSVLNHKPNGTYFILGQFMHNLCEDKVRKSFVSNVNRVEKDILIEYDLRDMTSNKHLHHKTNAFGKQIYEFHKYMTDGSITPPRYYAPNDAEDSDSDNGITPRIPDLSDWRSNESNMSLLNIPSPMTMNQLSLYKLRNSQSSLAHTPQSGVMSPSESVFEIESVSNNLIYRNDRKYKPFYDSDSGCMAYQCIEEKDDSHSHRDRNSAFIHDIIDPNKNINDCHLWVGSVFNCENKKGKELIQSQIVGLDYVKYSPLYADIGAIFAKMQFMFENVLNRKLRRSEKVIVRLKKCILQKTGDEYEEGMHKTGMGENIECVGMYFGEIFNRNNVRLQLSLRDKNSHSQRLMHTDVSVSSGDCVVFSNECYHSLQRIVHNKHNQKPIFFTVLEFYLIRDRKNESYPPPSSNDDDLKVNLIFNWSYVISFWLRDYFCFANNILGAMSKSWMNGLIYLYLFGLDFDEYVYDRRQNMISEKQKARIKPNNCDGFDTPFNLSNITHHLQSLLNDMNINQ